MTNPFDLLADRHVDRPPDGSTSGGQGGPQSGPGTGDPRRRRRRRSWFSRLALRNRMALLVGAAVLAGIAVVAGVALGATNVVLRNSIDDQLRQQVQVAGDNTKLWYDTGSDPNSPADDRIQIYANTLGLRLQVFRLDGTILTPYNPQDYVQLPVDGADIAIARTQGDEVRLRTVKADGKEYRVATKALRMTADDFIYNPFPRDYRMAPLELGLQLARPMSDVTSTLGELGLVMLVVGIVGVGGSMVAGLLVARAALRPVDDAAAAAEHVARTQDLSALIPVTGTDEIARLAGSLNSMLRALAASKARQRQLVDDASHELRTPLTSLRTNIELLIRSEANPHRALPAADRADLLRDVDGQTRELTGLVSELVELARDEAPVEEVERLDLAEVVAAAVERARRRATPKGIVIKVTSAPSWVDGRPNMLERAVTNLLDNAVKFSPVDSAVHVQTAAGEVVVSDEGPGIAAEDRPHVFERFYRSTDARSLPGSGLGLAIVADAVHTHGGTVTAGEAPDGGARMHVRLPLASPPETPPVALWDGPQAPPRESWAPPDPPSGPMPDPPAPGAPDPPSPAASRTLDAPEAPGPRGPDIEAVRRAYLGFTTADRADPHSSGGGADTKP
ncbi:ATP-binding protein [Pseudofrankia sp. BMG5.37]|uniref:sensor histidine kinase n=1 Tax=Pseudofrankia sp. BMG5.37 TaxID=3050035 RepID=UPI0037CB54C6